MLIFRGAVTYHPRGSSSAPILSPYYWLPPTSVSCTGVTEVQGMLAPFSAPTQPPQGAPVLPSPKPPLRPPRPRVQRGRPSTPLAATAAEATGSPDINFPGQQREAKTNKKLGYMFLILSAIGFVCIAAVVFAASQLLREDVSDERWLTEEDAASRSLVHDPSALDASGDRASGVPAYKSATASTAVPTDETKSAKVAGLTHSTATASVKSRSSKISRRDHSLSSRKHQRHRSTVRFVNSQDASRSSETTKQYRVFRATVLKPHQKLTTSAGIPTLIKLKEISLLKRDKLSTPSHLVYAAGHVGKRSVAKMSARARIKTPKKHRNVGATSESEAISVSKYHTQRSARSRR